MKEKILRLLGWKQSDPWVVEGLTCRYCGEGAMPRGVAPFVTRSGRRTRIASNLQRMGSRGNTWYRHAKPEACAAVETFRRNRTRGPLARLVWDLRNRVAA